MSRICLVAVAAIVSAMPNALLAQQDTLPDRPFVRGGVYDRPYLTTLLGRTAIGGYAEAHARWNRVDGASEDSGFEAKRFNLFTATEVSDFVRIGAELEIEEGGDEIKLEYAALDLRVHPGFNIRAGMLLSPLGRFNLSHDSPLNDFTDRPLVSTELLGTALSEPGLGVFGIFLVGGVGRLTYEAYATNGFHDGLISDSPEGVRIPLGRGNVEDNNSSPALVSRIAWSPSTTIEVGLSGHMGAYNEFNAEGIPIDQRRDLSIGVVDFTGEFGDWSASGEFAAAWIDVPGSLAGFLAERQRGFYTDVTRSFGRGWISTMPQSVLVAGVRIDVVDFDADQRGDNVKQITLGLDFRPTAESVLKFGYVRGRGHDRFNNPADHATVQFSFATYF